MPVLGFVLTLLAQVVVGADYAFVPGAGDGLGLALLALLGVGGEVVRLD